MSSPFRDEIEIAEFKRNSREMIRIILVLASKRRWAVNLRAWYRNNEGGYRLSRDGIVMMADRLPELAAAVTAALECARAEGLIDDDHAA